MSADGYFIHIEGIPYLFADKAYTMTGVHADLGNLATEGYSALPVLAPEPFGKVRYEVDPIKREAKVGVLNVDLVDYHGTGDDATGVLTNLFSVAKPQTQNWLMATIQQATAMAGAGTVTGSVDISAFSFPEDFYIERETFTGASQAAQKVFGGVTRARYGSIARMHRGTSVDNYLPQIYLNPPYWIGRICSVYRVIGDDAANAVRFWGGPLLDLTPSSVNDWTIKIGSVIGMLSKKVFGEVGSAYVQGNLQANYVATDSGAAPFVYPGVWWDLFAPSPQVVEVFSSVTCSANSANATTTEASALDAPDDFYNSQYAIEWLTGNNAGYYCVVKSWDNATTTFTHSELDSNPAITDTFRLIKYNNFPPNSVLYGTTALIGEEIVGIRNAANMTDTLNGLISTVSNLDDPSYLSDNWMILRGIEGTAPEAHADGDAIKEIVTNYVLEPGDMTDLDAADDIPAAFAERVRIQTKGRSPSLGWTLYNPLEWFVRVFCSTGEGWNYSGTNYDVFHKEWGAGIDYQLIRASDDGDGFGDGFIELGEKLANFRLGFMEPVKLGDLLSDHICGPLGLYPTVDTAGRLAVRLIRRFDPNATPAVIITNDEIIEAPTVTQDHVKIRPSILMRAGYRPQFDEYSFIQQVTDKAAGAFMPDQAPVEIEANTWTFSTLDLNHWASGNSLSRILSRIARPQVMVSVPVPLDDEDGNAYGRKLRPGDTVQLTTDQIPLPDNARGSSLEWFEVREVELDFNNEVAELELFWLGWYAGTPARWSYTGIVSGWDAGTKTATVTNELQISGEDVTDFFKTASSKVRVHYCAASRKGSGVYGDSEEMTVASVTATTIVFTASPTNALIGETGAGANDGDIITFTDYANANTEQKLKAYIADDGDSSIPQDGKVNGSDPYVLW
jgi:hypothetical protein